jgi:hypothetical protein
MKASPKVYTMIREEIKINEIPRKKERLIEVDEDRPNIELLKEVVNAETECKEIENLRIKHEKETVEIRELYEPESTGKDELGNEQDVGLMMSKEMSGAEDEEFKILLYNMNEVEVLKMNNEEKEDKKINVETPSDIEGEQGNT